jgi:hypothetical protein
MAEGHVDLQFCHQMIELLGERSVFFLRLAMDCA